MQDALEELKRLRSENEQYRDLVSNAEEERRRNDLRLHKKIDVLSSKVLKLEDALNDCLSKLGKGIEAVRVDMMKKA